MEGLFVQIFPKNHPRQNEKFAGTGHATAFISLFRTRVLPEQQSSHFNLEIMMRDFSGVDPNDMMPLL